MRKPIFLITVLLTATLVPDRGSAAASYIVVDNQSGHILEQSGANQKRQVASLTKIATAMVAMDWADKGNGSLATVVAVPPEAAAIGGVNPCGLQPGDQASLRDLLYAALMQSDNHAAYTVASYVGSRLPNNQGLDPAGNFVAYMNALARTLGMKRTVFLNPHGLDSGESPPFSTAADIARLTRYAYAHPGFNFYVSQPEREISIQGADGMPRSFLLRNTNELLGQDGIDGVKTGRTARAGDCLVLSADRPPEATQAGNTTTVTPRRIIVVLLASPDRFGEGRLMMQRGWSLYDRWAAQGRPVSKKSSI